MPQPRKNQPDHLNNKKYTVGLNLQTIRKKRGITQQELADKIGVTRQAITSYEAGRVHIPVIALIDIALVLNVSADVILGLKKVSDQNPNLKLVKRMNKIAQLPPHQQKALIKTIDMVLDAAENK